MGFKGKIKVGDKFLVQGEENMYFTFQVISKIWWQGEIYFVAGKVNVKPDNFNILVLDKRGDIVDSCLYNGYKYIIMRSKSKKSLLLEHGVKEAKDA